MRGSAEFIALLGVFALLLGGVLVLSSLSGPDCTGFQCMGRDFGVLFGSIGVVVGLLLLVAGSVISRRRR
jgi:hypothetical protein